MALTTSQYQVLAYLIMWLLKLIAPNNEDNPAKM